MNNRIRAGVLALALCLSLAAPIPVFAEEIPTITLSSGSLEEAPDRSEASASSGSSASSDASASSSSEPAPPASSEPEPPAPDAKYGISLLAPSGWYTKSASVEIRVEDVNGTGYERAEVKLERNGSWQDITDDLTGAGRARVEISENCTVYVSVTDPTGKTHTKNRYIECFDREAPTLRAKLDGKSLRVEASDELSGVEKIYVNGYRFTELTNGTLDVRLRDYVESGDTQIDVAAVDFAGNRSKTIQVKNPYYKEKDTACKPSEDSSSASSASSKPDVPPASSSSSTAPAKPAATPSQPAASKPEEPAKPSTVTPTDGTGNTIENSTKKPAEREFFTIETENGNIFYLVVDKEKQSQNVYLLSDVNEDDLAGLAKPSNKDAEEHSIPDPLPEPEPTPEPEQPDPAPQPEEPEAKPERKSSAGAVVIILLAAGGAVAGYYFKILKPRRELDSAEDIEDIEFVEDEPMVNEDELEPVQEEQQD